MIALIDYDAGNMKSVEKALQLIGEDVLVTRDPKEILAADKVVLPGVGSFGDGKSAPFRVGTRDSPGSSGADSVFGNLSGTAASV